MKTKVSTKQKTANRIKPVVNSSANGKVIEKRYQYYHGDDCYIYETICGNCKKKVGGWSELQANEEWEKHCC